MQTYELINQHNNQYLSAEHRERFIARSLECANLGWFEAGVEYVACIAGGEYYELENECSENSCSFQFFVGADQLLEIYQRHGKIDILLHSHIRRQLSHPILIPPSARDIEMWMAGDIPVWGMVTVDKTGGYSDICWLDDAFIPPLIERPFVHGIYDCYSSIRDFYRLELNITLKNYPRDNVWWESGKNLYVENFADAGFVEVDDSEYRIGDVLLSQISSHVINHGCVVTGSNQVLNHFVDRLSRYDDLHRYQRFAKKHLRYQTML